VKSVGEEFKHRLPGIAANMFLAVAFGVISAISSIILVDALESIGFYSWLIFAFIAGVFFVRALFDVLAMGDKIVRLLLVHLGVQERLSKRRVAKDLVYIIATILVAVAIFPLFKTFGTSSTVLQSVITVIAMGIIFLFVYDIVLTFYRILEEKTSALSDLLAHKSNEEDMCNAS
jgi:hypothetical protein